MIDNVILNNLANQNKAPYELIKKRAKKKGLLEAISNTQLANEHSKHSTHGQLQTEIRFHSHSKIDHKQSALCHFKSDKIKSVQKTVLFIHCEMNRRSETRGFKGGFIPAELKSTDPIKSPEQQNTDLTNKSQVSSDREERLSDPRCHKKPPAKGKKITFKKQANTESTTSIQDARELIQKAEETRKKSNFP